MHKLRTPLIWDEKAKQVGCAVKLGQDLFYLPDQFGAVFQAHIKNDSIEVKRLDTTIFSGYNGGQYVFFANQKLYGFGGYGIWRVNGQLRVYIPARKEWEIVKLDKEIPSNNQLTYYDPAKKLLWCGRQDYLNEVLSSDNYRIGYDMYCLDISTSTWVSKGESIYPPSRMDMPDPRLLCETNDGVLIVDVGPSYKIYDFPGNRKYALGTLSDSLVINCLASVSSLNKSLLFINNEFLLYDHHQKKIKWKIWFDKRKMTLLEEPVYKKEISTTTIISTGLMIILPVFLLLYKNQRKANRSKYRLPKGVAAIRSTVTGKTFFENLTAVELEILQQIKKDTLSGEKTGTDVLNHLLGTEKKNIDIQKKQRSDILLSINEKYKLYYQTDQHLICKMRLSEDKRLFKYYINEDALITVAF